MTIRRTAFASAAALTFATILFAAPLAHAQGTEKDADAERLFNEAKTLMEAKKFAEACPKLELAYRKDQQQGTLLNLAYCHKEMGSTWVAWTEFREADSKATDAKRKDFAHEKMKEIEKSLTKLVVDPQTKYELTEVILEDRRIYDAEKSVPFFAEANNQRKVIFHAKGKKPAVLLISVGAPKDKMQHLLVPEMVDEEPVVVTPTENNNVTPPTPPPTGDKASTWSGQKTLAVIVGVVGVGGVAVGTIFGLKTMLGNCADGSAKDGNQPCSRSDRSDVSNDASLSTIGFIAGGALLTGAVVLWILAPSGEKSGSVPAATVTANVGPSWAGLTGTF